MKVLIVEDDHLVRKGIVSLMPWEEYDLVVAGEAENGEKALQFLARSPVDLIMTDVFMPTMNGLELIKEVKRRYPHIAMVVLTFYQDFETIQEALRLGAIDYITKVELEKENMGVVLQRITNRVQSNYGLGGQRTKRQPGDALLLISLERGRKPDFLKHAVPEDLMDCLEIGEESWLLRDLARDAKTRIVESALQGNPLARQSAAWAVVEVKADSAGSRQDLIKRLVRYIEHDLFYEFDPDRAYAELELTDQQEPDQPLSEKELYEMREKWTSLAFVFDEAHYRRLLAEVEYSRPPAAKLESMFYHVVREWEKASLLKLTPRFDLGKLSCWKAWTDWLQEMRALIRGNFRESRYSEEVLAGVMRAVDRINRNIRQDLKLTEVAEEVHISKSYFSECFKDVTGKTFNAYIRDARIDYAMNLLSQTNEPIYRIAEICGYPDEKYFSKVFRKKVGVLPSEIRKSGRGGKSSDKGRTFVG